MSTSSLSSSVITFISSLRKTAFQGDIEDSYGARIVASTDNSVYQVIPQAILYPKQGDDINHIVTLLAQDSFKLSGLSLVARGGGTGTNGQSLNESLVLDTSRYLNTIINLDKDAMEVVVEPGVVLDQLNAHLAKFGLFFPPDVSSSSRATLGGMVATDASGKGSRIYGKTSDYIKEMDVVLSDGSDFCVKPFPHSTILSTAHPALNSESHSAISPTNNALAKRAQQTVYDVIDQNKEEIKRIFPKMNRGLTGYNLEHVIKKDSFNLSYLLAGSEGTLALSKKLTLRVIEKPQVRALVVVLYKDFDRTLEHVQHLLKANPTAIEVLDDKLLSIAQKDSIWQEVETSFQGVDLSEGIKGLNFIEVTGDTNKAVEQQCNSLETIIAQDFESYTVITSLIETNTKIISSLWGIRKRAVGLLGALEGSRQPTAFVEDTAVPPENLPAYIKDFRAILDTHGLAYGMYGHADVGCLHVRPALDMRQNSDQKLLRTITDQIAELSKKYGGLLWGEHGRGYRGEYSPFFFGEQLYPLLEEIKAVFDPYNLFNPGKLSVPQGSEAKLTAIDEAIFRGSFDQQLSTQQSENYQTAIRCNGNGACFNWDKNEAMCPSYKSTKDKRYSPKGRAAMLREWLRLLKSGDEKLELLEEELFISLDACLSCKSCTHSCPIKVDIPDLKSQFLQSYYQKHKRPIRDHIFASFESFADLGRANPKWANLLFQNSISKKLLEISTGILNTPKFSKSLEKELQKRDAKFSLIKKTMSKSLRIKDPQNTVILLPDSFNASYDSSVLLAAYDVISRLGYKVIVAPIIPNGKALHVKGFRDQFQKVAKQHIEQMELLAKSGLPLLSLEVATRLMYSKEYADVLGKASKYEASKYQASKYIVTSIEAWLVKQVKNKKISLLIKNAEKMKIEQNYTLFPHCMEQTADKQSYANWQLIFDSLGIPLTVKTSGCCGMSGIFGHEKKNKKLSDKIYQDNWQANINQADNLLATGFSCRCQLESKRVEVEHPIEVISGLL